jgi:hypothetical protein
MKRFFLFSALFLLAVITSNAQSLIAVNHAGGGSSFFTRLDSALAHAGHGDYITLPGTTLMNIGDVIINKSVHIIGAGIHPDSTMATGITYLTGSITVVSGADNGSLQGFYLNGTLRFGSSKANQTVSNYFVSRCNLGTVNLSHNGSDSTSSSFLFRENIVRGLINGGYSQAVFRNNIIEAQLNYFYGATFENNEFLWGNTKTIDLYVRNSTFANNNFKTGCFVNYGWSVAYSYNNNYYNNMFIQTMQFHTDYYGCTSNIYNGNGFISGNLQNISPSGVYTSQSGNYYDIHDDYHLVGSSPGKNAGTDGTDIGIYGGSEPFKDGSLPVNPHIQYKSVSGSTNPDGTLNIHFKVSSQSR